MRSKKRLFTISVFLLSIFLLFAFQPRIGSFLSPNMPCPANIMVVEGWLSNSALWQAKKEFTQNNYSYLITTGGPMPDAFELDQNGKLNFTVPQNINYNPSTEHLLVIMARGTRAGNSFAKMRILIDNKEIKTIEAGRRKKEYSIQFKSKKIPDTISISFINNAHVGRRDRNLYVDYIRIDSATIAAKSILTEYRIQTGNGTVSRPTNIKSFADKAAIQFRSWGIDSSKVISLPTPYVRWYRTFTSAVVVSEWLKRNNKLVKGINICSQGDHARRTWLIYRRALKDIPAEIGIISIPKPKYLKQNRLSFRYGILNEWRELAGYLYMRYLFNDHKMYIKTAGKLYGKSIKD